MKRTLTCCALIFMIVLTGCSDLDEGDIGNYFEERHVYPTVIEAKLFCNTTDDARRVIALGLVRDGFVTAKTTRTPDDNGKPLIFFTDKATPFLLPTSDTLKSFWEQRLKIGVEHFVRVTNIEINPSGERAVVDYLTVIKDRTPFSVLYRSDINGELPRRTFFTRKNDKWQWDGRIAKMPNKMTGK